MVFLKAPIPGKVKTRLGASIGMKKAAKVSRLMSETTIKTVRQFAKNGTQVVLWCDPSRKRKVFQRWLGNGYRYRCQKGKNLGERMERAFQDAFEKGARRVMIIGTDCPGITPAILRRAFEALDHKPVAIGPSRDGGYYLLGLREMVPGLFRNVEWSSGSVFSKTLSHAKKAGFSVNCLKTLRDVDTIDDFRTLKKGSDPFFRTAFSVKRYRIGVAVIRDRRGSYLLSRRPKGKHLAGLWEFPGGKCHPQESIKKCIVREGKEELGVEIKVGRQLMRLSYHFPGRLVTLHFHKCRISRGVPQPLDGQRLAWVPVSRLHRYPHPEANLVLLKRLRVKV